MIALDLETVGYNLVRRRIGDSDYYDKDCFCNAFTIDLKKEPCLGSGQLEFMKELLWINGTYGSTYLPDNWKNTLRATQFAYIPIEDWHWPVCGADMLKQVTELTDQCATDDYEVGGYYKVKRAVESACFCREISYGSCGGLCPIFVWA